ncbi:MAG: drug/metabolite transporter (DMT)-like permease [Psychromonas sp.]|jgi:drug/metabolite transporter (DMT)-like permease|uniref:DMT family transporter n=1 Tax=Psychromonas sp. TaxID=1884585 RepID=UPI0039E29E8A
MRGAFYLLMATLLAAVGWIASKLVVVEVPGDIFIAARFLIASLILSPFCYQNVLSLKAKQVISACAVGLVLALSIQVWVYAVSITNSLSGGAFIMSLAMIIAPLTSWLFFQTRPNKAFWLVLPVAMIGMMLLTLSNGWHVEKSQWCFLLSSALLSVHFVFNKKVTKDVKPLDSIFLQLFTVGISSAIFVAFTKHAPYELSNSVICWFVVSTIVATTLRYLLQAVGQYSVKIETASLIMILEPIWTLILSITMLDETVEPQKIIGATVIFLSLFVYTKLSRR